MNTRAATMVMNEPLSEEALLALGFTKVAPLDGSGLNDDRVWWRIETPDFSWCWTERPSFAMIIDQVRHQAITQAKYRLQELFVEAAREVK